MLDSIFDQTFAEHLQKIGDEVLNHPLVQFAGNYDPCPGGDPLTSDYDPVIGQYDFMCHTWVPLREWLNHQWT